MCMCPGAFLLLLLPPTSYANANLAGVEKFYPVRQKDYSTSSITVLNITNFSSNFC
jgi:hypothetical protein